MITVRRSGVALALMCLAIQQVHAEGMLEVLPYVSAGVLYDDNLFRFASKAEAKAAGYTSQSDRVSTLDAGTQLNLRISRQLVRVNARVNENKYSRYQFLDNIGKSYGLTWDWRIGSDVYGDLSTSATQSIAGFNDNDIIVRNVQTTKRKRASINWSVLSTWTLYGLAEYSDFENDEKTFQSLDREDDSYELGTRYQTTSGTQVSMFYRYLKSDFLNRVGLSAQIFGRENEQDQYGLNLVWSPTLKTRFTGQFSAIRFTREDAIQNDFSGFNQRWNMDYTLSGKSSFGLTAYREFTSVDDVLSTYVLFNGASANANWYATSKLNFNASYGLTKREFLGGSSVSSVLVEREDNTKRFGLGMTYTPTEHASLQLRYSNEDRDSNISNLSYQFQSINLTGQYSF